MKIFLFLVITIFSLQLASAQEATTISDNTVHNTAGIDVKPEYPEGYQEFYKFIGNNYNTPNVKGLSGKVYVTFVIEKDGSLSGIQVLRDSGYATGKEAIRVLELSPKWMPGEQNGQKARCAFSLPISIVAR
jgi:Gram-negative bacterial TonB protein C-terminal